MVTISFTQRVSRQHHRWKHENGSLSVVSWLARLSLTATSRWMMCSPPRMSYRLILYQQSHPPPSGSSVSSLASLLSLPDTSLATPPQASRAHTSVLVIMKFHWNASKWKYYGGLTCLSRLRAPEYASTSSYDYKMATLQKKNEDRDAQRRNSVPRYNIRDVFKDSISANKLIKNRQISMTFKSGVRVYIFWQQVMTNSSRILPMIKKRSTLES